MLMVRDATCSLQSTPRSAHGWKAVPGRQSGVGKMRWLDDGNRCGTPMRITAWTKYLTNNTKDSGEIDVLDRAGRPQRQFPPVSPSFHAI